MHGLPRSTAADEQREDALPLLRRLPGSPGPLWLGNLVAAEDPVALAKARITSSLNLALNIFPGPLVLPCGSHVRRYQIGMIDGPGIAPQTLAAAVLAIDGLTARHTPGKPHYPDHRPGGLLVHCRGGRSRSATVLAVWLHLRQPDRYPTLDRALEAMRALRRQDDSYPLPAMIGLAREVLRLGLLR